MGSAVPSDCQKHWTSKTAARGLVASFIHEASSPACAGKEGESFCYPSWERHRLRDTTCTSNFLCQPWYVFARIEIHPFSAERLSGSCQRGQVFIQTGHVWGVTQELIFCPVLSNSRCSTNILFLHSMKRKKMTLATITRPNVLIYCFADFVLPFQRSISDTEWVCGNHGAEGHCLAKNIQLWPRLNSARAEGKMWLWLTVGRVGMKV